MLVTLASGPERPSASVIVLFSNSAQSIATSEVLLALEQPKSWGLTCSLSSPPKGRCHLRRHIRYLGVGKDD